MIKLIKLGGEIFQVDERVEAELKRLEAELYKANEDYRSLYGAVLEEIPGEFCLRCLLCYGKGGGGASVRHTEECPTRGPREPGSTIGALTAALAKRRVQSFCGATVTVDGRWCADPWPCAKHPNSMVVTNFTTGDENG